MATPLSKVETWVKNSFSEDRFVLRFPHQIEE